MSEFGRSAQRLRPGLRHPRRARSRPSRTPHQTPDPVRLEELLKGGSPKLNDLCRSHGIARHPYYRRKAKFSGLQVNDAKGLRALKEENRILKASVADLKTSQEPR